jgi:DNA-binding transcriptional ArsR family regulator
MNMSSYSCCDTASNKSSEIQSLSVLLKLVGDETRLRILCILNDDGEHCVCELIEHASDLSQSLISHHLADLKKAGLVESKKIGLRAYYTLTDEGSSIIKTVFTLTDRENGHKKNTNRSCGNGMCNVSAATRDNATCCS